MFGEGHVTNISRKRDRLVKLSGKKNVKLLRRAEKNPKHKDKIFSCSGFVTQSVVFVVLTVTGCHGDQEHEQF